MKRQDKIFFRLTLNSAEEITVQVISESGTRELQAVKKIFSAAELWNIQRRRKAIIVR
jgi:hypothetical protein